MIGHSSAPGVLSLAAAAFLIAVATAQAAQGQDFEDLDAPAAPAPLQRAFDLNESNFEMWVYGNTRTSGAARDGLASLLELSIAEVELTCRLTDAQREKLKLAGRGDMKHFQDRVAEARLVFDRHRRDQNKMNEIHQAAQAVGTIFRAGIFGEGSLLAKTIRTTLDPGQAELYRAAVRERERFRYRAKVELAVTTLDDSLGLTADQRRRLIELMLGATAPPLKVSVPHESRVILLKMAKLPEAELRPIFDDAQWRTLGRTLQQARGMEAFLRANGYRDDDEPDARTAKPAGPRGG